MPDMPARIAALPKRGNKPIPWFVDVANGVPDFRVIRRGAVMEAVKKNRCLICGQPIGRYLAFVIGPAAMINRISSEPPSHRECAVYAVEVCPFLANPDAERRAGGLPAESSAPPGYHMEHNPGGAIVWVTRNYTIEEASRGILFNLFEPTEVGWYSGGQPATRQKAAELLADALRRIKPQAEMEGEISLRDLYRRMAAAHTYLPLEDEVDAT